MPRGPAGGLCLSFFARCALIAAAAAGCGGKLAPLGDAGADDGGGAGDDAALGDDSGSIPVVDSVTPSSGPNSGGTHVTVTGSGFTVDGRTFFTFGGFPASGTTCTTDHQCETVSPFVAPLSYDQTVHVQATIGSPDNPPQKWSATRPQDEFTFTGGPPCTGTLACVGIYYPNLLVSCQPAVNFYLITTYTDEKLLATGHTVTVDMQNIGAQTVTACYGNTQNSSCTSFTTFTELSTYCGSAALCSFCKSIGGVCGMDSYGNVTCSKPLGATPGGG